MGLTKQPSLAMTTSSVREAPNIATQHTLSPILTLHLYRSPVM